MLVLFALRFFYVVITYIVISSCFVFAILTQFVSFNYRIASYTVRFNQLVFLCLRQIVFVHERPCSVKK